ncbi:MAG: RagB/SusD family nutrient uptake outer membrane protein [Marinifilaceae bacterium]
MKTLYYKIGLAFLALSMLSCQDWLDVKPKTEVEAEQLFADEEGFKGALAGVYTLMNQPELYGREMTFGVVDAAAQLWQVRNYHSYEDIIGCVYESTKVRPLIDNMWSKGYNAIANANNIVGNIDERRSIFSGNNYSIIKGEALAIRAYIHLDLLRLFGDVTKPTEQEAGIPYCDSLTKQIPITKSPKDVIALIIRDLNIARNYLSVDPVVTGEKVTSKDDDGYLLNRNYHLNYYAVTALMARAYLYAGDKVNALKYAKEVIKAQSETLFPWSNSSDVMHVERALRDRTFSSEHLFALNVRKMNQYIKGYFIETSSPMVNREKVADLFVAQNDLRSIFFEVSNNVANVPSKLWQMDAIAYEGKVQSAKKDRMPMIKMSEMYYLCAECDAANAFEYLNAVLAHRGYTEEELLGNDINVMEEIEKEMKREHLCEGQLFYFYKRTQTVPADANVRYVFPKPEVELEFGS